MVLQVESKSKISIPSAILSGIALTLVPVYFNGEAHMYYKVLAGSDLTSPIDTGGVSKNYKTTQYALKTIPSQSEIKQAEKAGDKLFCLLLNKAIVDAQNNYTFY